MRPDVMEYIDLKAVLENCENVKLSMELPGNNPVYYLTIGNEKVESVSINCTRADEFAATDLAVGWDCCPDLKALTVNRVFGLAQLQAMFRLPKPSLVTINLSCLHIDFKKAMDALVDGHVRTIEFCTFRLAFPSPNTFYRFSSANKSLISAKITISVERNMDNALLKDRLEEVTRCFLLCPALRVLKIHLIPCRWETSSRIDAIEDLLRTRYRHRRIHVSVFGHEYSR